MPDTAAAQPETLERVPWTAHVTFLLCAVLVASFLGWSAISTIDIVSMAMGEVIPSTQVKTIQHLEGGIVRKILVREGQRVEEGQALVVLEPTASSADVGELRVRLRALTADLARLDGLIAGAKAPSFPPDLIRDHPELVRQSLRRFQARRARHQGDLSKQRQTLVQREHEIREITSRIENSKRGLVLLEEQIAINTELVKINLSNRYQHLDLLKEKQRLAGGIETDAAALSRAQAALLEARLGLENITYIFDEENQTMLDEARLNFRELEERVKKFEDNLKRTVVRSPVTGVIKLLHVVTVGGVLRPGDPIADVVPSGDRLIIEAKLPTGDVGYVEPGQTAVVKLASADGARFGQLDGKVISVSPDTLISKDGNPFYKVLIETPQEYFQQGELRYNLLPGMQVTTSIQTGTRTVLEYVSGPLSLALTGALQER